MEPLSLTKFNLCFARTQHKVKYIFGSKPAPGADSLDVRVSDCSGYTRWLLARATGGKVILPEGSVQQREWCEAQSLHRLAQYSDVQYAANDNSRVFMAFLGPHGSHPSHVWFVLAGRTRECCGSLGVASRPWDEPVLLGASTCFELPTCS